MERRYINEQQQLIDICEHWEKAQWLVVDTEFMRETTYYAELCLVQIADQDIAVAIDPLVLDSLEPLKQLFQQQTLFVFHAGSQDLEIFYQRFGELPKNIFDTQIAAAITGHQEQIGYAKLVESICKVSLDKQYSRTDWAKRPLSTEQMEYALNDVIYLGQVYLSLKAQLENYQRMDWLVDEFSQLSSEQTYINQPEKMWRKVKQHQRLKPKELVVLQALASWRESKAVAKNKPRRQVLKDDLLIDISRFQPITEEAWLRLRGISAAYAKRLHEQLTPIIHRALATDQSEWPTLPMIPVKPTQQQEALADYLTAVLRLLADKENINPTTVATRKHVMQLVQSPDIATLNQGWRKQLAGNYLLETIEGKHKIFIDDGQVTLE